ncbi:MAG: Ig-like domain-containing protein, partial [Oscillospiraceae bacterium]|nr:Ig-like domain-containing protein [Oscillospiraceae bacterium]
VPDGFADVFQLKEVSTSDEDMVPGPYQGSFEYNTKYWSFGIASTGTGNWDKQSDGTAFMYYFIKVTPDEDKIAATAEKMGIKLESDAEGSYYKFPVAWDTNSKLGKLEAVDTNRQDVNPTFTDGSIKVYVNKKAESTAATTVAKTTESTKATEATAATDVTKATDATTVTDVTKATEATAATDVTKATEATAATDFTKATEATAATDVTKATEATAATDATKATEATTVATVATTKGTTTTQAPLEVSPKSTTIEVGESFTINAKAADNPSFKYGSNPTNVVVVDATGKVTGINPGETKVLVYTDDGRSDTVLVKVVPAKAATTAATTKATKASYDPIKVNPSSVVIDQGESKTIEVSGGDGDYSYEVIDPSIAIVSPDGTITGRKPGSTKVIVKDSVGNTATVEVTVNAVTQPATTAATTAATTKATQASYDPINATPKEIIIAQGEKAKINVVGGDGNYTFTPSDDSIVTVAPDGTVTGVKPGDVKVIVKDGVGNTDTVTVKVTALTQATTTQASAVNTDATTAATTPAAVVTTAATTPAAVVTTAANNNPTIDPSSDISSNSTAAYFFSVEKNFNKLTKAIKFVGGTPKTVTYQYNGKTVAGPKDVFVKKTHKYELTVLADGKAAGKVTVYIGVKGDANLDDAVDSKDAVAVLITFANAITGQKKALQSDASLETLATYLADVDTETLDYKKLDAKDAVYMLKYFANEIAGNSQPWNKLCKELADRDY